MLFTKRSNQNVLERNLALVIINALMPAITSLLPGLAMAIVILVGFYEFQAGRLSHGGFFTFTGYVFALTFPTFILGWVFGLLQRGAAAMQRIDEILSVEPAIRDHGDVADVSELSGEIEFRNLTFAYDTDTRAPALRRGRACSERGLGQGRSAPKGLAGSVAASTRTAGSSPAPRQARSRSTAPAKANCAPEKPSTK